MFNYSVRPVRVEDAEGINALRCMPGVFETILGLPSERISQSESFISGLSGNDHILVAVTDENKVIGCVGLNIGSNPRTRHCGSLGLMVHKEYQRMGVGETLMKSAIDIADNWLMLLRLELGVFEDNEHAIRLYEKLGFQKEGLKRCAAVKNGKYANEYLMSRIRCGD